MTKLIARNRLVLFCMALFMAVALSACSGLGSQDPLTLVATAPDKAATLIVLRGDIYCALPAALRQDFRAKVKAAGKTSLGAFQSETIICDGDPGAEVPTVPAVAIDPSTVVKDAPAPEMTATDASAD